ncbi:MAG: hypothetical protein QMB62_09665 [Oscillospiraceae bacterium]
MIDQSKKQKSAEQKEQVRRRINTKVDQENYEFIPPKKQIDYYDNESLSMPVFRRAMSNKRHRMSCRRNIMRTSSFITPTGRL